MLGLRPDPDQIMALDDLGELGVFAEEAIAGMDRVGVGDLGRRDDVGDVEIAVLGRRRADADRFVGQPDVHRIGVGGRMDRDRLDAHLMAGAMDAQRNLAAVGDQQFLDGHCDAYSMTTSGWSNSTGWESPTRICVDLAGLGRGDRVHHLHRLDDQQRVALLDRLADGDERLGARLGRQEGGADHRRLDRVDRRGSGAASAAGSRCAAQRSGAAAAGAGA